MTNREQNATVSVVLPCRNEELSLGTSIKSIQTTLDKHGYRYEIIVSDSSTDRSPNIAKELGVTLIKHDKVGYGTAYIEGFKAATGKYIICADPDGTYDFTEIPIFINELREGADFVIGDRFKKAMQKGAMPWTHRYIGNPGLSLLFRLFFKNSVHDVHCGMRAIRKKSLDQLHLHTTGMEFASEMIVQVLIHNLQISELPINYYVRKGESKLRTFQDGWRHLRFMLLYSPTFLFFYPGLILSCIGVSSMMWLYISNPTFLGITFFFHPMFISSLLILLGYQLIFFHLFARTYAAIHLGWHKDWYEKFYAWATIEKAALIGGVSILLGVIVFGIILYGWIYSGFSDLQEVQNSIVALTLIVIGMQTFFSSFIISILGIRINQ